MVVQKVEKCLELPGKTSEQINDVVLVLLLFTLNIFDTFC